MKTSLSFAKSSRRFWPTGGLMPFQLASCSDLPLTSTAKGKVGVADNSRYSNNRRYQSHASCIRCITTRYFAPALMLTTANVNRVPSGPVAYTTICFGPSASTSRLVLPSHGGSHG
jgi:hypothetical protein